MIFIVRLFSEITIKSPPVRKRWSRKLVDNLKIICQRIEPRCKVQLDWDRILVKAPDDCPHEAALAEAIANTPGISNYSLAREYPFTSLHEIYERALTYWQNRLDDKTFCVRVKRSGKHEFNSLDAEKYIGGGLNQHTGAAGVKLKDPDITVFIEIKDEICYIVQEKTSGLGGFPIGTQEEVLSLVSGGFDSTVASYLMMRRGLKTHYCFFNLGGREHEVAVKEIAFYLWNTFASSHRVRFISVPFEAVVAEILEKISPSNMGVVLKRMMLRAAQAVAERGEFDALVTGEAIAQVSSQTLPNLQVIDEVCDKLVLRPLIAMDKPGIIDTARSIGTEEFSAAVPEYCGVISVRPSAKVNRARLLREEEGFDMAILEQAIAESRAELIDEIPASLTRQASEVVTVEVPEANDVILDIRHPNEIELKPLPIKGHALREIPFYTLSTGFADLEPGQRYLLYCDKGVMSKLHAAHLMDQGHQNVAVLRPVS